MILLFFCTIGSFSHIQAQDMDLVDEVRGDTLVVKNLVDVGESNSLIDLIESDSDAPEDRVYLLKRGTVEDGVALPSLYLQDRSITFPDRPIQIVGEEGPIVGGTTEDGRPPLIAASGDDIAGPGLIFQDDFTFKNIAAVTGSNQGSEDWALSGLASEADNKTATFENVLMEHNNWVFFQSNDANLSTLHIRDSYLLNMSGRGTRRNGGVYDSENYRLEELVVENTTHVQAAGIQYKFRNHPPNRVFINHNTFVNATGQLFASRGYEHNMTVTNNLFVNSNVQAYYPGLDDNETDINHLPHGIINLNYFEGEDWEGEDHGVNPDYLPDGFEEADRKILVANNGVYWDPRLDEIVDHLNENDVACGEDCSTESGQDWISQMITMNDRTQTMFDNEQDYPLLTEGEWIMGGDPEFTAPNGLMTDYVDAVIDWGIATAPTGNDDLLEKFRSEGNEAETGNAENFINFDWPVAADLAYSNSAYVNAGLGEYPLGDLNWFPNEKDAWIAEKDDLYAELETALNEGRIPTSTEEHGSIPNSIKLDQNYPNPFNPTTQISFTLPQAQEVTLKVYDMLGREVATLVNRENFSGGQNSVQFDASNLSSGIYIYSLQAGDVSLTKKMTLIK